MCSLCTKLYNMVFLYLKNEHKLNQTSAALKFFRWFSAVMMISCLLAVKMNFTGIFQLIFLLLQVPIYANASRRRILQSFGWPELSGRLCSSGQSSPLHVLPLSFLRHEVLVLTFLTFSMSSFPYIILSACNCCILEPEGVLGDS